MADPYAQFADHTGDPYAQFADHPSQSYDSLGNGQIALTGSPAALAAQSPIAGNNFGQNVLIGSGKQFTDMGQALRQMLGLSSNQDVLDKRALDAPVAATAGGEVGQIGTGILTSLPLMAIPGAQTYAGTAAIGSGLAALNPVAGNESRALNAGMGAGLSVGGKFGFDMLGKYLASGAAPAGLTGAQASAASTGQELGMRMTPGQQLGSKALQQFEAKMQSQPWTSGPFNQLGRSNQNVLNSTAASAIGELGNSLDANVLGAANDRLGAVFESVRNPEHVVSVDPQVTGDAINSIDKGVEGLLPGNASIRDNPLVKNFETLTQTGEINGQQLGQLSSKLGKAAYKQMTGPSGDRDLGQALYAVKDHADDLLEQSLSGPQQAEYGAARQQYRALMQLTSRVGTVNPSTGDVSGVMLANRLQQSDRPGFLYGGNQSDLYNAARFAQAFKPIVGDSGTATRLGGLTELPFALPANFAARAYLSGPGQAFVRGAMGASQAVGDATQAALPYAQSGLPGLSGALVPYLTK